MAKTNWQDPKSSEIISPHISGLQEAIGKLEESLGISSTAETGIVLSEVYISETDRYRIYQASEGKRNWLSFPTPIVKKNGVQISTGFIIEYGGGAIVFTTPILGTDIVTADATYTIKESTSVTARINTLAPHPTLLVTGTNGVHGLKIESGTFTSSVAGWSTFGVNTYSIQHSTYYLLGKICKFDIYIEMTVKDAAMAGSIVINDLPFASKNQTNKNQAVQIGIFNNIDLDVTRYLLKGVILPNTNRIWILQTGDNVAHTNLTATQLNNTTLIQISGVYEIA